MILKKNRKLIILTLAAYIFSVAVSLATPQSPRSFEKTWGPRYKAAPPSLVSLHATTQAQGTTLDMLLRWNRIAVDASGLDHTPVGPGETRVFGEQLGPCRASRAMAIVHIAIFDAINAIDGGHKGYTGIPRASTRDSMSAAIAQAAHDTLVAMFPSQKPSFDQLLNEDLNLITDFGKAGGIALGKRAAKAILGPRDKDGSHHLEPLMGIEYIPSDDPGIWRQDPISLVPIALGGHWSEVNPFVIRFASQFRTPPPPAMSSEAYAIAFNEAKQFGGDGITTPTVRIRIRPRRASTGLMMELRVCALRLVSITRSPY